MDALTEVSQHWGDFAPQEESQADDDIWGFSFGQIIVWRRLRASAPAWRRTRSFGDVSAKRSGYQCAG